MPLPTMTASASLASRKEACDSIATPFIDRTRLVGQAIETRQSGFFTRLRMPKAISEFQFGEAREGKVESAPPQFRGSA